MGGGFDRDPGKHNLAREAEGNPATPTGSPGKSTLTGAVSVQLSASAHGAASTDRTDSGAVQEAAAQGVAGNGGGLPHGETYHVDNVKDFFQYQQAHNADRAPASIWADGQWWGLHDYHQQRDSVRLWTPRATIQASLKAGNSPEIRPGDTCLIDHGGGNSPSHIVMVESYDAATRTLVSIEGNTYGIHADKDGKAERLDDDHLKDSAQGSGTAAGIHQRDMSTLAPGPTTYTVKEANAYVREDDDLTKFKMDGAKKVALPVGSSVVITETKDSAGARYGHLQDGGWTRMSNLATTAAALPKGAAKPNTGATVWGVGRPSVVDFEDGHEYAVHAVPAELQHTSPADIKALAKKKDKAGAQAKAVGVKP